MYHPDIWRTVDLLTRNCGAEAGEIALERANTSFAAGDRAAWELWIGITRAMEDFFSPEAQPGETIH